MFEFLYTCHAITLFCFSVTNVKTLASNVYSKQSLLAQIKPANLPFPALHTRIEDSLRRLDRRKPERLQRSNPRSRGRPRRSYSKNPGFYLCCRGVWHCGPDRRNDKESHPVSQFLLAHMLIVTRFLPSSIVLVSSTHLPKTYLMQDQRLRGTCRELSQRYLQARARYWFWER